jgi:hypothetical protein
MRTIAHVSLTRGRLDLIARPRWVKRAMAGAARKAIVGSGVLVVLCALAACGSARGAGSQRPARQASLGAAATPTSPCGPEAAETLARTVGLVGSRIYANELSSSEVARDKRQVESFTPLLDALARRDRRAVREAVMSLVFSHTHVVRLRVSRGGEVLADVGGPEILAPVSGTLRRGGTTVGHYVLSVQDDLGYVKLVTRFTGVPLVLREGSHTLPVAGAVSPGPASIPAHGPVSYRGRTFEAFSFDAQVFPSGALRISLLVPVPASLSHSSCSQIKVAELGDVARRISRRFTLSPGNFSSYIRATAPLTGGLIYIRSGARQLAGSTSPGPSKLPNGGSVQYRGATYGVFSFTTATQVGPVRIYQLVK